MPRDASKTRAAILIAAHVAFFRKGYTRVWMTDIARTAGITKRTLYQHFESKDALLEAMLAGQSELSAETFARSIQRPASSVEELVSGIFGDLFNWAASDSYTGPGFTRLAMELGDLPGHPAMRFAAQHKTTLESLLSSRLSEFGLTGHEALAREIWIVMEGAMMLALVHGDPAYVVAAKGTALRLLSRP